MRNCIFKLFLGLGALSLLGCVNNEAAADESMEPKTQWTEEKVKEHIKAMEDTLAMAYNQQDINLFEKFYAEGAVTYGEGREQLFGKDNIINHFRQNVVNNPDFSGSFKYHTIDVFTEDDLATETGRWEEYDTSGTEIDHGFYMVVFKRENGRYRSIRDMWNSATAASVSPDESAEKAE